VLTAYLLALFIVFNEVLKNQSATWVKLVFAAWLGARGICDAVVWMLVVIPAAVQRDGRALNPWWRGGSHRAAGALAIGRTKSRGGMVDPLLAANAIQAGDTAQEERAEEVIPDREGEELNIALRDEVLYFTLVGLRAAAAGEHMSGQPTDIARPLDLEAAVGCTADPQVSTPNAVDRAAV